MKFHVSIGLFAICAAMLISGGIAVHGYTSVLATDYQRVPFKVLRQYEPGRKIPDDIRNLHGKKVEVLGFMSALTQLEDIDEFLLASSPPMNCYCHPPLRINEMIVVHMKRGKTTEYKAGVVKIRGTLKVNTNVEDEFADVMYTVECDEVL